MRLRGDEGSSPAGATGPIQIQEGSGQSFLRNLTDGGGCSDEDPVNWLAVLLDDEVRAVLCSYL